MQHMHDIILYMLIIGLIRLFISFYLQKNSMA